MPSMLSPSMATRKQEESWGRGVPEKRIMMMAVAVAVAVAVVVEAAATMTIVNGLTCVEHRGRCMREELLAHQVVALDHALHVVLVDADRNAHEQMLRALHDEVLDSQQVAERKS